MCSEAGRSWRRRPWLRWGPRWRGTRPSLSGNETLCLSHSKLGDQSGKALAAALRAKEALLTGEGSEENLFLFLFLSFFLCSHERCEVGFLVSVSRFSHQHNTFVGPRQHGSQCSPHFLLAGKISQRTQDTGHPRHGGLKPSRNGRTNVQVPQVPEWKNLVDEVHGKWCKAFHSHCACGKDENPHSKEKT